MQKIALLTLLLMSASNIKLAQAQDDYRYQDGSQRQYQEPYQEPEQYRTPQQDQRYPTTMSNGDVIVPTGSGYSNTRNGDYYPETSPGWVVNPRTGEPIHTH